MFKPYIYLSVVIGSCFSPLLSTQHDPVLPTLALEKEDETSIKKALEYALHTDLELLLEDQSQISKLRGRLEVLHPLQLIAFIASDAEIIQAINNLDPSDIKLHFLFVWLELLLSDSNLLEDQVLEFAHFLHLDHRIIASYVVEQDYAEFIQYVFNPCK